MGWASWRTGLIFLFILCVKSIPLNIETYVGHQTELPCKKTCNGLVQWVHLMTSVDSAQRSIGEVIAEFNNKAFSTPTNNEDYSITKMPTEYNHNGVYACRCDNETLQEVNLKVICRIDKLCYVGENVTLNFFEETKGLDYNRFAFFWKKDGQPVVKINGGNAVYSKGFEKSVNKDALGTGDLSLTLPNVNSSDGGLYELIIVDRERQISFRGRPQAYKLTVQETAEPSCKNPTSICCMIGLTVVVCCILGTLLATVIVKLRSRFCSKQGGDHGHWVPESQGTSDERESLSRSIQEQGLPGQLSTVKPTEGDKM